MKIILNSDVLVSLSFNHGALPDELQRLCDVCRENGILIVLPLTTVYEFNHRREGYVQAGIKRLQEAYEKLDSHDIAHDSPKPADVVGVPPDLIDLINATGANVEVVEPTQEEFMDALKRASFHEAPRGKNAKSDEMRDLTIWAMALRVARLDGSATLVADDHIFHDPHCVDEATLAGLTVVHKISDFIEQVRAQPAEDIQAARSFLEPIWDDLVRAGLPAPLPLTEYSISNVQFTMGEDQQPSNLSATLLGNSDEAGLVSANALLFMEHGRIVRSSLTSIKAQEGKQSDEAIEVQTDVPAPVLNLGSATADIVKETLQEA